MIADDIRRILEAKADALVRRSADDMAALLHRDFVYVNTSGRKFDKAGYVANGSRFVFRSQKVSDLDVRAFGDTAVATMTLDDDFTVDGREVKATFKSLCVFTKRDGKWLWSAGQTMWPAK